MNTVKKFRVFNPKTHAIEYFDLNNIKTLSEYLLSQSKYPVQQYIGMKDKNENEIYEGDLVNFYIPAIDHGPDRVDYTNEEVWYSPEDACYFFGRDLFHPYEIKDIEVVGTSKR